MFLYKQIKIHFFSGSLGGRDYDSMSGSLGVRGANSGTGAFATDFRSGLGDYL